MTETARVDLAGDYLVTWTITPAPGTSCMFGGGLWGTHGNPIGVSAIATTSGMTHVHDLGADRYYFKGGATCPWSVTLTPE